VVSLLLMNQGPSRQGISDTDQAEYHFFPILFAIVILSIVVPLACTQLVHQAEIQKVTVSIEGVKTSSACRALEIVERKEEAAVTKEAKLVCLSEKGEVLEQVEEVPSYKNTVRWIFPNGSTLESK